MAQHLGQCEDDVEVGNGQHVVQLRVEPTRAGGGLTLGTVPIAAGVVGIATMAAAIAGFFMAAQGSGSAGSDVAQGAALLGTERSAPSLQKRAPASSKDMAQVQPLR